MMKRDVYIRIRPVHLKFGVALAMSVGGILYAFIKINNRNKPTKPKLSSSGNDNDSSPRKENVFQDPNLINELVIPQKKRNPKCTTEYKMESLFCDNIRLQEQLVGYGKAIRESEDTKKSNEILKQDNSDLLHKLDYLQMLASSALDKEELQELKDESRCLQLRNDELTKEIKRMQADRWTDIEELVYLRWINACLRYQLRNIHAAGPKTFSKALSPKLDEKTRQRILERAYKEGSPINRCTEIADTESDPCSSSYTSGLIEGDDMFLDTPTFEKPSHSRKTKVFAKFKRLLTGTCFSHPMPPRRPKMGGAASDDYLSGRFSSVSSFDDIMKIMMNSPDTSSRRSFDLPRPSSRTQKIIYRGGESYICSRRNSDVGTANMETPTRVQALLTDEEDNGDWQPQQDAKEELLKYAELLKTAHGKRSASFT